MSKRIVPFLIKKFQELKGPKDDIEELLETLKPINSLLLPLRDQNIISIVYHEYNLKKKSQCDECGKMFLNNYIRDFHQVHIHKNMIFYTCYICDGNTDIEESEMYFSSIYLLHAHLIEHHDEPDYGPETQQLIKGI